jgi:hypothetical protein
MKAAEGGLAETTSSTTTAAGDGRRAAKCNEKSMRTRTVFKS